MIYEVVQWQPLDAITSEIKRVCASSQLGALVEITPIEPEYTRPEENTFHWLLDQWLKLDRSITWPMETLKTKILMAHFGAVRLVGPGGQEEFIPARKTTKVWDHDLKKYRRKKLTVAQYAELITFLLDFAAMDGTILPVPVKERETA